MNNEQAGIETSTGWGDVVVDENSKNIVDKQKN